MVFVLALFIFAGVEGTLLYSLWKYRARKGRQAAQIHGNTKLEVGWTVGAAVILIFITFFTFLKLGAIKDPKPSVVDENGNPVALTDNIQVASTDLKCHQGPDAEDPGQRPAVRVALQLPRHGQPARLHRHGRPGRHDRHPGHHRRRRRRTPGGSRSSAASSTRSRATRTRRGSRSRRARSPTGQKQVVYTGQCAELCGRNHANMYARVIGMRMADYKKWYADKVQAVKDAETAVAKQQKALQAEQTEGQ